MALIFTAINAEKMTREQAAWRWGFVLSCIISGSMSSATLIILLYSDLYKSSANQDIENNVLQDAGNSQSASLKTVATIISNPESKVLSKKQFNFPLVQLDESRLAELQKQQQMNDNFPNLTSTAPRSPVTVVDMPAMNKRKRAGRTASPVSIATVKSDDVGVSNNDKALEGIKRDEPERKRNNKGKKHKMKTIL